MSEASTGTSHFEWVGDPAVVMFCITCVEGVQPADVLESIGAEADQGGPADAGQVDTTAARQGTTGVRVASVGPWSVLIEFTSLHGADPDVLAALSTGTRAVALYRTGSGVGRLVVAEDGAEVTSFEPAIPRFRRGTEPDRYLAVMREAGFDPDDDDGSAGEAEALELIRRLFGITVTTEVVFDGRWPAGHLPR